MSGCADVCLNHDYDGYNSFYVRAFPIARKPHKCCECFSEIQRGQKYERASGKSEDGFFVENTCMVCAEIRDAFVCGTFVHGMLWESINEEMFPIWKDKGMLDCLAKLTTLEAREKCRAEYADWEKDR